MKAEHAILGQIIDPHLKAIINVELTNGWQCNIQDSFFKAYHLSHQQYNILRILRGQHPKGVSVNDIKRRMIDKMSNVSRLVEKLKQKNYVERTECESDRRVVFVHLTESGLTTLSEIDKTMEQNMAPFKRITIEEAEELSRILEKLREETPEVELEACPKSQEQ
ncbi:MAG: MarR family transcriptional regulator [Saprospiraceae bacterium]|nr:MarR family transcriptional regulator [Saprospiraceae bacterium]